MNNFKCHIVFLILSFVSAFASFVYMYTLFRETYLSVTSRFFSNNTCWNEWLITPSGLVFVGQILGKSSFVKKINHAPIPKDYLQKQIKNGDVLLTYIGMLCQGKPQYEAVREMMDDPDYYKYALGIFMALCIFLCKYFLSVRMCLLRSILISFAIIDSITRV